MWGVLMWSCRYNKKAQHVAVEIINGTGRWHQAMSSQNRKWIIYSRKLGIISQATKRCLEYSKDTASIPACCWQGFSRSSMPQHKTASSQLTLTHWRRNQFEVSCTCAIIKVWISEKKGIGRMAGLWTVTYDQASWSSAQLFIPHRHECQTPWKIL